MVRAPQRAQLACGQGIEQWIGRSGEVLGAEHDERGMGHFGEVVEVEITMAATHERDQGA